MSDYDLGKAHGRIEIDADVDTRAAEAKLGRFAKIMEETGRSARGSARDLDSMDRSSNSLSRAIEKLSSLVEMSRSAIAGLNGSVRLAARGFSSLAREISSANRQLMAFAASAILAKASAAGLGRSWSEVGLSMGKAGLQAGMLYREMNQIRNGPWKYFRSNKLDLMVSLLGGEKAMNSLPKSLKAIQRMATITSAIGVAAGFATAKTSALRGMMRSYSGVLSWTIKNSSAFQKSVGFLSSKFPKLSSSINTASRSLRSVATEAKNFGIATDGILQKLSRGVTGIALFKSGIDDIRGAIAKLKSISKILMNPMLALGVLGGAAVLKFLPAMSTGILGVVDALKQLSGVALILPGMAASFGVMGATLMVAIKGISGAFKAGFGDAEKFADAIADLSPEMQAFAYQLKDVKKEYKGFSDGIAKVAFRSLMDNFKSLAIGYMPLLKKGMTDVASGLNSFGVSLSNFLGNANTRNSLAMLFQDASKTSYNLGISLLPVLNGLRNIGEVGARVFANLTEGSLSVARSFEKWTIRHQGDIEAWIRSSLRGFGDLKNAIRDFSVGFGQVFRHLGGDGSNALERMANSAAKFRKAMSGDVGKKFAENFDKIQKMGSGLFDSAMNKVVHVVKDLWKVLEAAAPAIQAFSQAFGANFVQAIDAAASILTMFMKLLSSFDGAGAGVIGWIAGSVVAFKLLSKTIGMVIGPITTLLKLTTGSVMMKGLATGILNIATGLDTMGRKVEGASTKMGRLQGKVASMGKGMQNASTSLLGLAGGIGGALTIALSAAVVGITMYMQKQKEMKQNIEEAKKANAEYAQSFRKMNDAYRSTAGEQTPETKDSVTDLVNARKNLLEKNGKQYGGISKDETFDGKMSPQDEKKILEELRKNGYSHDGHEFTAEQYQRMSDGDALNTYGAKKGKGKLAYGSEQYNKNAKTQLDETKKSAEELSAVLTGSQADFDRFLQELSKTSNGGKDAANVMKQLRNEVKGVQESYARNEGAAKLAQGLKLLADAATSAEDKLKGLKMALEGLGFDKRDKIDAIKQHQEAIKTLADSYEQLSQLDFSNVLGKDGQLNLKGNEATQQALVGMKDAITPLVDDLYKAAINGEDLTQTLAQNAVALDSVRQATGMTTENFQKMIAQMGYVPAVVETVVQVKGKGEAVADLTQVALSLQGLEGGTEATVYIKDEDAIATLRSLGIYVGEAMNSITGERKIHLNTDTAKAEYGKLVEELKKQGVEIKPNMSEADKQKVLEAIKKLNEQAAVTPEVKGGGGVQPPAGGTQPSGGKQPTVKKEGSGDNGGGTQQPGETHIKVVVDGQDKVDALKSKLDGLKGDKGVKLHVDGADVALGAVQGVQNALSAMHGDKGVRLHVDGADVALGAVQGVQNALSAMPNDKGVKLHVDGADVALGAVQGVSAAIDALKAKVGELATAFEGAMGRAKTAISSVGSVMDQLTASATGRGASLGEAYAQGIESKAQRVREAAEKLATAATDKMGNSPAKSGPLSGKGWTLHRGERVAEDYAEGIGSGTKRVGDAGFDLASAVADYLPNSPAKKGPFSGKGNAKRRGLSISDDMAKGIHSGSTESERASFEMVAGIVKAMDGVRAKLGFQQTFFWANQEGGPSNSKYYRDPDVSDEDLRKRWREEAKEKAKQDRIDAIRNADKAQDNLPKAKEALEKSKKTVEDAEERLRKAKINDDAESTAKTQKALADAQKALDNAKKTQNDRQAKLDDLQRKIDNGTISSSGGSLSSGSSDKIDQFVEKMDAAGYQLGGFSQSLIDCSGFVSSVVNTAQGKDPFESRMDTHTEREWLLARGFKEGKGGDGDLSVAWNSEHTALTTPSGRNAESTTGGVRYGADSAGARSNNSQFTNFMYLPGGGNSTGGKTDMDRLIENTDRAASAGEKTVPLIQKADGTWTSSNAEWAKLINRESGGNFKIVQGVQDANSGGNEASGGFQIAKSTWAAHGGTKFAPTAGEATPEQQALIAARIFEKSGAGPWGNRENEELLRAGLVQSGSGSTGSDSGSRSDSVDRVTELRKNNKKLDQALKIAQDRKSSEIDTIRALQTIDDQIAGMNESDRDYIEQIRDQAMSDKGYKVYDPKENAPETPREWFDTIFGGIMQNSLSMYKTIVQGLSDAKEMAHLIVRGVSSTDDVNTMIDGFQGLANSVMEVVSTVGSMINIAASIAAAAGSAIPGIGPVVAAISAISGGVGDVNAVIDFAQEVAHIGGRFLGKGISSLIGFLGGTGELQGQIRTMLDMNDNTIKTWSDRNTADKAVIGSPFGGSTPRNPNESRQFGDLNIYQGPGQDPAEMMNNAMFAVAAHSQGVYGG